jgi:L-threonylcarbamoyladenylate synthase
LYPPKRSSGSWRERRGCRGCSRLKVAILALVLEAEGGGTVGVRVPAHSVTRAVLASHRGPFYATSANRSGGSAPRAIEEVELAVSTNVDFAVRGEPGSGEASAVVDLSGHNVRLLRPTNRLTEDELTRLAKG